MHTTFTGSTRKPRQVNLSGRNAANPWASLPGSTKSTQSGPGTQSAIAQAQADRVRRQQERDRINAAKKIQKTWRGHASRLSQKQKWRKGWDTRETERLGFDSNDWLNELEDNGEDLIKAYPSEEQCLEQVNILVRFYDVNTEKDASRLTFVGNAMKATIGNKHDVGSDRAWSSVLRKLARTVSRQLEGLSSANTHGTGRAAQCVSLLGLNVFITEIIPKEVGSDAAYHFRAVQKLLVTTPQKDNYTLAAIGGFVMTMLLRETDSRNAAFTAFVREMLTRPEVRKVNTLLEFLQFPTQQITLGMAVVNYMNTTSTSEITHSLDNQLWLLSYMTYLRKEMLKNLGEDTQSFRTWLEAVSILLSQCANEIAARIDEVDQNINGTEASNALPFHPFVQEQISTLSQQSSVVHIMDQLRSIGGSDDSRSSMAKPLANYAVALLRSFPQHAGNIRVWLYRGSPSISGDYKLSTIRYLWHASERTAVFHKIRDQRNIMSVLTEAAPDHHQIGRAQVSTSEIALWQEEWRIILLFMELYTFILKLMDDEEFFALDKRNSAGVLHNAYSSFQKGALPLKDIARLITFLKNLAFPLYWHAADLEESNEVEESGGLAALFGTAPTEPARLTEKKIPQTLAGNGVSQAYLKGLVTGLLRMLHERDSRRKFLKEGHWLMTSQFDMLGFIPAVVAEEERRHEGGDDEDDLDTQDALAPLDEPDEMDSDAVIPSLTTMFGIRAPHMPRTQNSRYSEQMRRRREVSRRKRQSLSLAPRLEILRNLPFFIPFDTRVQIFREFIYRNQMKRRNGYIDPDQWRMSVAHSSQGRGGALNSVPSGIERLNRHKGEIRRGHVFQDAYDEFFELGEELKEPIQISFIDQFGAPEAGIDGGGVTKEFLISVTSEAFDPHSEMRMFVENEQRFLYPNPNKFEAIAESLRRRGLRQGSEDFQKRMRALLQQYEFLGRVVGKCLYEGILVDVVFAGFFLLKWSLTGGTTSATYETSYRASINDLRDFDESLYQGLLKLKNYNGDVESDFALNFTVTDELEVGGRSYTITKDLIPNGSNTSVTNANRMVYIDKITRYRLQQQPALVTNYFLKGLGQIIQPMWLAMFNQRELQKLVGGDNAELDIGDLRRNTQYGGLYVVGDDGLEHPTVSLFWKVLRDMEDADRRKVLKFVTSTPRAPLLGFSHLNPKFSIRDSSEDQTRLPSTSTCVNLLKLPRYGDERTMREKLLYAVNSGAGFDLS